MDFDKLTQVMRTLALEAGDKIMEIYDGPDFEVKSKSDDSPVTIADEAADAIISAGLRAAFPDVALVTEEQAASHGVTDTTFLIVDPLDGTKEFIKRNGEFTVNIALIENQKPVFGVIYVPVTRELYIGDVKSGSGLKWILNETHDLPKDFLGSASSLKPVPPSSSRIRVVGSRSHMNEETEDYIESLKKNFDQIEIVSKGSSLKFCLVAENLADVYPRFAPTMEWDTAAGQAICEAVGLEVISRETGEALLYNREDMLNGHFLVRHSAQKN